MAELKDKIENALNETRMLVIGAQVMLGLKYQAAFQGRFNRLPFSLQCLDIAALLILCVALALLMWPALYHQIVEAGRNSMMFDRFLATMLRRAVWPFAIAFGIDLYIVTSQVLSHMAAVTIGLAFCLGSLFAWYGAGSRHRLEGRHRPITTEPMRHGGTPLKDRIKEVLIEARVILPGVQALLGFQFVTVLTDAFERLPPSSQYVHVACLGLIAVSTILLMTPAAYHRIAEDGQDSTHFFRTASRLIVAATVPLAFGLAGDLYVVTAKVTDSTLIAQAIAMVVFVGICTLWYGYSWYSRSHKRLLPLPRMAKPRVLDS
jgi:hypothetical protein